MLFTQRLILRPWTEQDAEDLYTYASDPAVGPITGWPPHRSAAESLFVIQNVLAVPETYAICMRTDGKAIGSISIKLGEQTDFTDREDECEIGFWLGKPFWGNGIMPEAAKEILRHAFVDLSMRRVFCGYYDGNLRSKRVQEKLGFQYQCTIPDAQVPMLHETRIEHVTAITKEEWQAQSEDYIHDLRRLTGNRKLILNCAGCVVEKDGRILFQRRSDNGEWSLVGGLLELGETYAQAAKREVREETGLAVELDAFLGIYHNHSMLWPSGDRAHTLGAYYAAHIVSGALQTDAESLELRFFAPDEIPKLFAEDHRAAVKAYLSGVRYPIPEENAQENP